MDPDYAAIPKRLWTNRACPAASRPSSLLTCPFLIMCNDSMPSKVLSAVWKGRQAPALPATSFLSLDGLAR